MIKITNATKKYKRKTLFENIDLQFEIGQIYGFIGQNGCGKTTIFKAICGLTTINEGTIEKNPAHSIEFIDDKYTLLDGNVNYNLQYYLLKYPDLKITEFEEKLRTYEIEISSNIKELSKGEKALVRLALAQASSANYILIDELLDGLDLNNRVNVIENIITDPLENRTYIIIDHNIEDLIKLTENFYVFERNKIKYLDDINDIYLQYPSLKQWFKEELR